MKNWATEFKLGRVSTEVDPRLGHPKTTTTDEQVDPIQPMVLDDVLLPDVIISKCSISPEIILFLFLSAIKFNHFGIIKWKENIFF